MMNRYTEMIELSANLHMRDMKRREPDPAHALDWLIALLIGILGALAWWMR